MEYVKDELRPKMFHVLPKDEFIREVMFTTFVTRGITNRSINSAGRVTMSSDFPVVLMLA